MSLCRINGVRAELTREAKDYHRNYREDRVPFKSWKRYRNNRVRGMTARDSILNHLSLGGIMSIYKFTCTADPSKNFEVSAHESLDMHCYIDAMIMDGFEVMGPNNVVHTLSGAMAVEPKLWPETLECGHCGDTMDLVSIEDGYSCRNRGCLLHFKHLEHAV